VADGRQEGPFPALPGPALLGALEISQQVPKEALQEFRRAWQALGESKERQKVSQEALQEYLRVSYDFLAAVRACEEAVSGFQRGKVSQEEVIRCQRRLQAATRRVQVAGQALRGSTSGRSAPRSP
jgi:hypothetical protein